MIRFEPRPVLKKKHSLPYPVNNSLSLSKLSSNKVALLHPPNFVSCSGRRFLLTIIFFATLFTIVTFSLFSKIDAMYASQEKQLLAHTQSLSADPFFMFEEDLGHGERSPLSSSSSSSSSSVRVQISPHSRDGNCSVLFVWKDEQVTSEGTVCPLFPPDSLAASQPSRLPPDCCGDEKSRFPVLPLLEARCASPSSSCCLDRAACVSKCLLSTRLQPSSTCVGRCTLDARTLYHQNGYRSEYHYCFEPAEVPQLATVVTKNSDGSFFREKQGAQHEDVGSK